MNIDDLTVGEAKELANLFSGVSAPKPLGLNIGLVGEKVIIRTYSAGNWFGKLSMKSGNEVILEDARRLWYWKAKQEISLSAVALYGIDQKASKIVAPVKKVWLEAIEIIPCTKEAIKLLEGAPNEQAR